MTALAISCATVKAQKVSFGVKAGIQENTLSLKYKNDGEWSRQAVTGFGFHAGGVADISLSEKFSLQPQLLYAFRGTSMSSKSHINIHTVDLPVNFLYKTGGFFIGVGPNLSYGLSAKSKTDGEDTQDLYKKEEGDEQNEAQLKRFELGANIILGYQFANNLFISANYTKGLSNIANTQTDHQKYSTKIAGLSVGYMFGNKRK